MSENEFQNQLADLIGKLDTLPAEQRDAVTKIAMDTKARHETVSRTISQLQESIDTLRMSIKYLVFDLEATRRENGHLRKLVEQRIGGEGEDEGND